MGIAEVWRYDYEAHHIAVHALHADGSYTVSARSTLLPELPVQALTHFVRRGQSVITSRLLTEVRRWVRDGCPELGEQTAD